MCQFQVSAQTFDLGTINKLSTSSLEEGRERGREREREREGGREKEREWHNNHR